MRTVLLVDGPNILMRAIKVGFTGIELSAPDGTPTAPVLFFINTLARHIKIEKPDSVIVCWDQGRSRRRAALSPVMVHSDGTKTGYKAHRTTGTEHPEQFEMSREFLSLAHIQQGSLDGEEADDIIAGHVATRRADEYCVIVSDDHDLRQLVSEHCYQVGVASGATIDWTPESVQAKYGCGPEALPYLMALMGDPGDGVRGLAGIGPKKGLKLLQKHDFDWPALLAGLSPEDRVTAELAYALVDLRHQPQALLEQMALPVVFRPTLPTTNPPRHDQLRHFLDRLGMHGVIDRLDSGRLWGDPVTV